MSPAFRMTNWANMLVLQVSEERNEQYEGMTVQQVADIQGKDPLDAFLDLALDEKLETEFILPPQDTPEDVEVRRPALLDPISHISVSDGGAHTIFNTHSTWPIYWLTFWIRDRQLMTLEQAHYKMSALPAWITDFKDRGALRVGNWADIIVYNLDELGFVYDKPIFSKRLPWWRASARFKSPPVFATPSSMVLSPSKMVSAPGLCPANCSAATTWSASLPQESSGRVLAPPHNPTLIKIAQSTEGGVQIALKPRQLEYLSRPRRVTVRIARPDGGFK